MLLLSLLVERWWPKPVAGRWATVWLSQPAHVAMERKGRFTSRCLVRNLDRQTRARRD